MGHWTQSAHSRKSLLFLPGDKGKNQRTAGRAEGKHLRHDNRMFRNRFAFDFRAFFVGGIKLSICGTAYVKERSFDFFLLRFHVKAL